MPRLLRLRLEHILFFLFSCAIFLIQNNLGYDYFWHLKAGEYLAKHGAIPSGDPFSFTFTGQPWVLHEWLFELTLYAIHYLAGHYGVLLMVSVLISISIYITYRCAIALSGRSATSTLLAVFTLALFIQFSLPRPQIITYLFFSIYLYTILGYIYRAYPVRLYWLPIIMALWVNMHGGYIIGLSLLLLFILCECTERFLFRSKSRDSAVPLPPLLLTFILCLGASLLNPYTYHQWLYPFQVMSLSATHIIFEWQSPDFHRFMNQVYLVYVFVFFSLRGYKKRPPSISETLVPLSYTLMSFVSIRHIPVALLALLPYFSLATRQAQFPRHAGGITGQRISAAINALSRRIHSGPQLGNKEFLLNWLLLAVLVLLVVRVHSQFSGRISSDNNAAVPTKAVSFIQEAGITGNVLNNYQYGGYLLYRLYPHSKVFIDGRADLYGDKFLSSYRNIHNAQAGWRALIKPYHIDYVLFENTAPILDKLRQNGNFILVYRDDVNSVLVHNTDKFRTIINQYRMNVTKGVSTL